MEFFLPLIFAIILAAFVFGPIIRPIIKRKSTPLPKLPSRKTPISTQPLTQPKGTKTPPYSIPRVAPSTTTYKKELNGPAFIIDGDSLVVKKVEIRLFGVDAPEFNHPYGKKAKWALLRLCKGQQIRAEIIQQDHFDRAVAKCFLPDGRDLSAEMVKLGLAIDWPKFSGGAYLQFEPEGIRKKLWLADARQKGRMDVWKKFEAQQAARKNK